MEEREYEFGIIKNLYEQSNESLEFCNLFYANDLPVPYKGLLIYPVNVCLYQIFHSFVDCLILDEEQLEGGDAKAIKMSYLNYLYYRAQNGDGIVLYKLFQILKICLRIDGFQDEEKEIPCIGWAFDERGNFMIRVLDKTYGYKDFNNIRKIICEQNCIEMPDMKMDPRLKKKYKEAEDFSRKLNQNKICSFEDMKSRITARTGLIKEQLNNLTIREFSKLIESLNIVVDYDIEMLLAPNMKKEDVKKIPHWLSDINKANKYNQYKTDLEDLQKNLKV